MSGQKKSRALDRLIASFDREFKTSIANTKLRAKNQRRADRGELITTLFFSLSKLNDHRSGCEASAWSGALVSDP